jgi:ribosomal-protein-alanine N-acetyltransferase
VSAALGETGAHLEDMCVSDVPEIAGIEARSYDFPWPDGIFSDCLKAGYRCRVLRRDGEIIAYGIVSIAAGEAHILNLCVCPLWRGYGWGRHMLDHLLDLAIAAAAGRVWLEVRRSNAAAMGLYGAAGFEVAGIRRGYYRAAAGREDALVLALDIGDGRARAGA